MKDKIRVYLWTKPTTDYDDHYIIKSMPNDDYNNPEQNAKNLAKMILDTTPGNTLDVFVGAIADHIRMLVKNPFICDGDFLDNPHFLESHIKSGLLDLVNQE